MTKTLPSCRRVLAVAISLRAEAQRRESPRCGRAFSYGVSAPRRRSRVRTGAHLRNARSSPAGPPAGWIGSSAACGSGRSVTRRNSERRRGRSKKRTTLRRRRSTFVGIPSRRGNRGRSSPRDVCVSRRFVRRVSRRECYRRLNCRPRFLHRGRRRVASAVSGLDALSSSPGGASLLDKRDQLLLLLLLLLGLLARQLPARIPFCWSGGARRRRKQPRVRKHSEEDGLQRGEYLYT